MALLRVGYRVAYRALQAWTAVRRPEVRGAMIAVLDGDRVLLVRHTYGSRSRWELPGGWVQPGEDPLEAARRELAEEVGLDLELRSVGALDGDWDFKHEHLSFFTAPWPGGPRPYDPVEIAEPRWFALDALPPTLGSGTAAVLALLR